MVRISEKVPGRNSFAGKAGMRGQEGKGVPYAGRKKERGQHMRPQV